MSIVNLFIAKRKKKRIHVFLRALKREELDSCDYSFSGDELNDLLIAQDAESFVRAVSNFYPLSLEPLCRLENSSLPRKVTVEDFRSNFVEKYELVDQEILLEEYTGIKENNNLNKSSLRRSVKEFDAIDNDNFLRFLDDNAYCDDDFVLAEPVLDWCAVKSFLSNIVLFQAKLSGEADDFNFENVVSHNGFWIFGKPFDKRIRERVKQFMYNPAWKSFESLPQATANDFNPNTYGENAPWFYGFTELVADGAIQRLAGGKVALKGSEYIQFKTANELSGDVLPTLTKNRKEVVNRSLYLVAPVDHTDDEIAHDFINAVLATMHDYQSYGKEKKPLGWELNFESAADQLPSPAIEFYSQGSRLLYETAFHSNDLKAAVCKQCGTPMFSPAGTKMRQFCRASCKTKFFNNLKERRNG